MASTLRIAWRNLGRNRRRTVLALAAIAIAQTAVLAMDGLMNGFAESTLNALTGPMTGHAQVHDPLWREEQAPDLVVDDLDARLTDIRGVDGVAEAFGRIYAPALVAREVDGHPVMVVGVDIAREAGTGLLQGLPAEAQPEGRNVLLGASLAREMDVQIGDELALLGQAADGSMANDLITVAGFLETPVELVNRSGIVMPLAAAQDTFAMPDQAHEITIMGAGHPDEAPAMAAAVGRLDSMQGLETLPWRELSPELAQMLEITDIYGLVVLFIVFLAAAAGVANTMLMATYERRRELGMLLALGATPRRLIGMILLEAVGIGLLGVILGSILGAAFVAYQGHVGIDMTQLGGQEGTEMAVYGLEFAGSLHPYLSPADVIPGFIGVVVVSVLSALWPAFTTARLEPVEAMRG
ncbi:MAG: ABC transporter permease [Sandaracinaceae bacterium]